ncbi:response regulator transcription factor [Alteromonas portus]|uniref:Phosphate regulon transcriptional regulatory protein PhoB n=1 Tax=Alteromonas portus TaxID=2565549 RepID=A0A4U0ZE20_9ALTE|nr:response regulator transcription factor [Alteromonas portus]TKB04710.1 response regulator transcription factor [Alteromonas portus]
MILIFHSTNQYESSITQCLNEHCYLYDAVSNFNSAISLLSSHSYSLLIIECLGTATDIENLQTISENFPDIWIMTVGQNIQDRVGADLLDAGADDFLPRDFNERLFISRVRAHMRRCIPQEIKKDKHIEIGPLSINISYHTIAVNGERIDLTAREFSLLEYFCRHPNQVFSRNQLLSAVWGYNHEGYEHTVNTHINRLRTKLESVTSIDNGGQLLKTVWGVGYKLNVEAFTTKALSA